MIKKLQKYGFKGSYQVLPDTSLKLAIEQLQEIFSKYFSPTYINSNFKLPDDYLHFITSITSYLSTGNHHTLYSINEITQGTQSFLKDGEHNFLRRKQKNQFIETDVMWLMIGWWSDKHDLILCCDSSSIHWGKIYDVWDDHPWSGKDFTTSGIYDSMNTYVNKLKY